MATITIAGICNNALDQIGYKRHISTVYDGTPAARIALNAWSQTRDSLLYRLEPAWARRDEALTLIGTAPSINGGTASYPSGTWTNTSPPLPWLYLYGVPPLFIKPLQVKDPTLLVPIWRPRAVPFKRSWINGTECILTNTADAVLTYIQQIFDPNQWDNDFQDAMIEEMRKQFEPELGMKPPPQEAKDARANNTN